MKTLELEQLSTFPQELFFDGEKKTPTTNRLDQTPRCLPFENKHFPVLSPTEVNFLAGRIAQGDQAAKDKLVLHNMGLVYSVAQRYWKSSLPIEDLVQEGVFGLMRAAERYDPSLGNTFSTYAVAWIRHFVRQAAIESGPLIRLPTYMRARVWNILSTIDELLEQGIRPTPDRIATRLDMKVETVQRALIVLSEQQHTSLDAPILSSEDGTDATTVGELVLDTSIAEPILVLEARQRLTEAIQQIGRLLDWVWTEFSERNYQIFVAVYGLDSDRHRKTLESVGQCFSVTRERIRQVVQDIWERSTPILSKETFLHFLENVHLLEELAGTEIIWSEVLSRAIKRPVPIHQQTRDVEFALLKERMRMLQATAKERLTEAQYAVFNHHYGLEIGGRKQTLVVTARELGMSQPGVMGALARAWRNLSPYARHINRQKVDLWLEALERIRKESG